MSPTTAPSWSSPTGPLNIGFLHKPDMEVSNPRFIPGSQGDYEGGRMALAVDAKMGKFKAILVGVHLKSGRDKSEQDTRDTQCKVIGDWLSTVRDTSPYGHHTLVLLGDFNMIPGQDVSNFHHLGGDDVMDFVSCWDLQDRFSHILDRGRANLLDGFAVSRTFSRDYVRGSLRLFPNALDHGYRQLTSGDGGASGSRKRCRTICPSPQVSACSNPLR